MRVRILIAVLKTLIIAYLLVALGGICARAGAEPEGDCSDRQQGQAVAVASVVNDAADTLSLPPEGKALEARPEDSEIYQLDNEPLGGRRPLLLIHGGNGEHQRLFRWDRVIERLRKDDRFDSTYKIYLLRYNSSKLLEETLPGSRQAIVRLARAVGGKPITIVALSEGGNVAQLALVDPEVDSVVELVLAMATPFHGSPLFSEDWFEYGLYKSRFWPILRVLDSIDYRIYFHIHKSYLADLRWDDVDLLIPEVGYFRSKLPFGPRGYLTPERDSGTILAQANAGDALNKKKFITYAGYLVNPYVLNNWRRRWLYKVASGYWFVLTQARAQLGREQAALMVLNREISKVDTGPAGASLPPGAHVYALNDGITPVTSALFLPPEACRMHPLLHESDLSWVRFHTDVRKARVFRNINHVTFVDGKPPHHGSSKIRDELHPDEPERPVFDWILADLMEAAARPPHSAQALNSE